MPCYVYLGCSLPASFSLSDLSVVIVVDLSKPGALWNTQDVIIKEVCPACYLFHSMKIFLNLQYYHVNNLKRMF